jgi:hypothetical protein
MILILNDKPHIRRIVLYGKESIKRLDMHHPQLVEFCNLRGCLIVYSYWVSLEIT